MDELRDKNGLTEAEAIIEYRKKDYPKPALTADIVILAKEPGGATVADQTAPAGKPNTYKLLLIRRGGHPHLGRWALPGGFAEEGETIEETAARELEEETGYIAGRLLPLITVNTTVAFCNEKIGIFAALDLKKTAQHLDVDEEIELYEFTPDELLDMIRQQKMTDSKTVAGILAYLTYMK